MAKKKTESSTSSAAESKPKPAKKAASPKAEAPKKTAKKTSRKESSTAPGSPLVDTSLAAQNVARTLVARARLGASGKPAQPAARESGSFKQLKESLNKPAGFGVGGVEKLLGPTKSDLPISRGNQSIHSQTQGGTPVNVPRRTPG